MYALLFVCLQVKDKAELLLLSDKKELDTPLQVREMLIHLTTDELLSPELSQIVS